MSDDSPQAPRLPALTPEQWSDAQREVLEPMARDGRVFNVFATLAHHPDLLRRWSVFGTHLLYKSSLPEREREILILRAGWLSGSEYEWGQHVLIGRRAGLDDDEIRRIAEGPDAPGWSDADRVLLVAVDELQSGHSLTPATWDALNEQLDTRQVLDLIFTVGQYAMLAGALNSIGVERDEGVPGFADIPGFSPK